MSKIPFFDLELNPLITATTLYDEYRTHLNTLASVLSPVEVKKAAAFRFPEHRERAIVARGLLRLILEKLLDKSAKTLAFQENDFGKPYLLDNPSGIQFNLSHSDGMIAFAFTKNDALGIDVEKIKSGPAYLDIAQRFFTANEYQQLQAFEGEALTRQFLNVWTQKEAYIKAIGEGLFRALNTFQVKVTGEPALVDDTSDWQLYPLPLRVMDYCGSVVIANKKKPLYYEAF